MGPRRSCGRARSQSHSGSFPSSAFHSCSAPSIPDGQASIRAFSVDQPEKFQNDARVEAIKDAAAKADLYAKAVGYKVARIVTISEYDYSPQPPMPVMMRMQDMAAEATPIAAGEVALTQTVNVVFELVK